MTRGGPPNVQHSRNWTNENLTNRYPSNWNFGISGFRCDYFGLSQNEFQGPIFSMYGIAPYIYHKSEPNVGKISSPMENMGQVFSGKTRG